MHTLFLLTAVLGSIFFATRRQVDYFTVAYGGCLTYFLPGFFGVVAVNAYDQWAIVPETYAVMVAVMASVPFFAYLSQLALPQSQNRVQTDTSSSRDIVFVNAIAALSAIGLVMTVHEVGAGLLSSNKHLLMSQLTRWHILFYISTLIGFPAAIVTKRRLLAVIFMMALCFWMYVGFRSPFAIGVISALTLYLSRRGTTLLRSVNFKILMATVLAAAVLFVYKQIYTVVKLGAWSLVQKHLTDPKFYLLAIEYSEPFGTQALLNSIVANNFHTGIHSITSAIYSGLLLFSGRLSGTTYSFNNLVQSTFFPGIAGGLAGNIWAQMWSAGGWLTLMVFIAIYNIIIMIGNVSLKSESPVVRAGLAPVFVYWAFYIQRNALSYALNLEKRVLIVFAIGMLVAILLGESKLRTARR